MTNSLSPRLCVCSAPGIWRIERRIVAATADKLTQAILAKAFRGELVSTEAELARRQGRAYEPASDLLERIREKRTHHGLPAGRKRGRAPRQLRLST